MYECCRMWDIDKLPEGSLAFQEWVWAIISVLTLITKSNYMTLLTRKLLTLRHPVVNHSVHFINGLINDIFSNSHCPIASLVIYNDLCIIWQEVEGSSDGIIMSHYPGICLNGLKKTKEALYSAQTKSHSHHLPIYIYIYIYIMLLLFLNASTSVVKYVYSKYSKTLYVVLKDVL